jgi:ABC-2 type transport system ATP-binding protein
MEEGFSRMQLVNERTLEITYNRDMSSAGQVLAVVQQHGYAIQDVTTREPDLEDVFVQLTSAAREAT